MTNASPLGVAVIGAGYWGPNLIRNFRSSEHGTWSQFATSTSSVPSTVLGEAQRGGRDRLVGDRPRRGTTSQAVAVATPATDASADRRGSAAGRQARPGREAARRLRRARSGDGRPAPRSTIWC